MKNLIKKIKNILLVLLVASAFNGCAKDNLTIGDIALAPIYGVMTVGYVATKTTDLAIQSSIVLASNTAKTLSNIKSK